MDAFLDPPRALGCIGYDCNKRFPDQGPILRATRVWQNNVVGLGIRPAPHETEARSGGHPIQRMVVSSRAPLRLHVNLRSLCRLHASLALRAQKTT